MGHFADLMNEGLKARDMTKYRLSKQTGIADGLLSRYGSGKAIPEPATIAKIADALSLDVGLLLSAADADRLGLDRLEAINKHLKTDTKTRKSWRDHDLGQSSTPDMGTSTGAQVFDELSRSGSTSILNDNQAGNMGTNVPPEGQIIPITADFGPMKRLPVYRVSCGEPVFFNDQPEEWQTWPIMMTGPVDGIMLVSGESMLGCGFRPGDQLFFQLINGRRPSPDDKVVAEVEGGAVCKVYKRDEAGEYLVSAPGEDTTFFCRVTESVRLVGIVKGRYTSV